MTDWRPSRSGRFGVTKGEQSKRYCSRACRPSHGPKTFRVLIGGGASPAAVDEAVRRFELDRE